MYKIQTMELTDYEEQILSTTDDPTREAYATLKSVLEKQIENVAKLQILENFSIDKEMSLKTTTTVLRGLVVSLKPQYVLSPSDVIWFHPSVGQGVTVATTNESVPTKAIVDIKNSGLFHNSIMAVQTQTMDAFGCEKTRHGIIVDTSAENVLQSFYDNWLHSGTTAAQINTAWKNQEFSGIGGVLQKASAMREELVSQLSASAQITHEFQTCGVYHDGNNIYFTNHAIKHDSTTICLRNSALGGYRLYNIVADPNSEGTKRFFSTNVHWNPQT